MLLQQAAELRRGVSAFIRAALGLVGVEAQKNDVEIAETHFFALGLGSLERLQKSPAAFKRTVTR